MRPPPSNKPPKEEEKPKRPVSPVAADEGEAAVIDQTKDLVENITELIDEVKSYEEWIPKVMQSDKPVILDCYAE